MAIKRVLHVGLDTHLGGIETYLLKLASNIDKEKYEFSFLMYDGKKPCFYDELKALGCQFYNVVSRRANYFENIRELKSLFLSEHFDIVHCHQSSLSYIRPICAAVSCGSKVIVHAHNSRIVAGIGARIRHHLNTLTIRKLLKKKQAIGVAVSDAAGNWIFGDSGNYVELNLGIEVNKFMFHDEKRRNVRRELGLDNKEIVIHHGAFKKEKNHEFLIDVFHEYQKSHPNSVLVLVGEGMRMEEVRKKVQEYGINDKVIFLGLRRDIPDLLCAGDKYLFPSISEGFPNALIEAETSGLYCVAADTITKQVQIEGICEYVSLDAPLVDWAKALDHDPVENRGKCAEMVEAVGLGVEAEMRKISSIYEGLLE